MVSCGNSSTNSVLGPHRPKLVECGCALDRRLVDTGAYILLVCASVGSEVALKGPWLIGSKNAVRIDDVEFNQGVRTPAVEREITWTSGIVSSTIHDCSVKR